MKKRIFFLCLLWSYSALIYFSPIVCVYKAEASSLYYILDASGSMWGRVDGKIKIQAARDAMTKLITNMPQELLSGLTVYGHLKKGDCSDINELIPLGKIDRIKAVELIKKINPKGKTPIALTIEKTVQSLKKQIESLQLNYENSSSQNNIKENVDNITIVLISDGIETCGGDPCATTVALKSSGIKFIMHVVGFDVDRDSSEQLACIAKEGGGKYFLAKNSNQLLSALSSVQKSVVEKRAVEINEIKNYEAKENETIASESKIELNPISSSKSIKIKANGPGRIAFKHEKWLKAPYAWKLIDPETGEEKGKFSTLETTIITPGYYQLVWDQYEHDTSDVPLTEVIHVESGKTVEIPLMTAINLNVPSWVEEPKYWGLRDTLSLENVVIFNKLETFLVPAGEYEIIWRQGEHSSNEVAIKRVNIIPDKTNDIAVATAVNPIPAQWVQKEIHYWGLKAISRLDSDIKSSSAKDSNPSTSEEYAALFNDKFAPQLVPPGKYMLFYDISEHGSSDSFLGEIEVIEGKMNDFNINTGVNIIAPQGMNPPYFIEFVELGGDSSTQLNKTVLKGSFGPIALKPGKYKVNYRQEEHGSSTMTIVDEFELQAGNLVEIEL